MENRKKEKTYENFWLRCLGFLLVAAVLVLYNFISESYEQKEQIEALTSQVSQLQEQQEELMTAWKEYGEKMEQEAARLASQQAASTAVSTEAAETGDTAEAAEETENEQEDLFYQDGTYTGEGQGFGGTVTVEVTLKADQMTAIEVKSAPGEDSAYLSQAKQLIPTVLEKQTTDVDAVSGATFSSNGILSAIEDALGKAENS